MNARPAFPPVTDIEASSIMQWWLESGVDVALDDTAESWLKADAPVAPAAIAAPVAAVRAPVVEARPDTSSLFAFRAWMESASGLPFDRPGARRVMPLGAEAAPVMLVGDLPGSEEADAQRPLAGEAWTLTTRMLAAIGIAADDAYLANLTCFHAPGARIDAASLEACARLTRDHVRMAKPQRLLLLGDAAARALTGHPLARARGHVHRIEGVRAVATFHPRWLLDRPSDKGLAWKDLLLLMDEDG